MDIFVLQLAIIFLPGMIWERIDTQFALKYRPDQFDVIRRSFVFGLISYLITYGIYVQKGWDFVFLTLVKDEPFLSSGIVPEIALASAVSLVCSILYLFYVKNRILSRFLRFINATERYGSEDVWDYTFGSSHASVEYVHVRDFDKKITYAGWVENYSETDKIRELLIRDVVIYDFDGVELFQSPRMYLARPIDSIDVEFPYVEPKRRTEWSIKSLALSLSAKVTAMFRRAGSILRFRRSV